MLSLTYLIYGKVSLVSQLNLADKASVYLEQDFIEYLKGDFKTDYFKKRESIDSKNQNIAVNYALYFLELIKQMI